RRAEAAAADRDDQADLHPRPRAADDLRRRPLVRDDGRDHGRARARHAPDTRRHPGPLHRVLTRQGHAPPANDRAGRSARPAREIEAIERKISLGQFIVLALKLMLPYRVLSLVLGIALLLQVGYNLILPLTYRYIFDGAIKNDDMM